MSETDSKTIRWKQFPRDLEGRPLVTLGTLTVRIPFPDLVKASVYTRAQRSAIRRSGVDEPVVVDVNSGEVVDGMGRVYFAHELGLTREDVPVEWRRLTPRETVLQAVKAHSWPTLVLYPDLRAKYLGIVLEATDWDNPWEHIGDLIWYLHIGRDEVRSELQQLLGQEAGVPEGRASLLLAHYESRRVH